MSGLTISTERGTVEVPQDVEAQGGDAVQAYVDAQLVPATTDTRPTRQSPPPANHEE